MAPDGEPLTSARESAVDRGRIAYHAQKHKHAIAHFSGAINSCPCSKSQGGARREKCSCKNYEGDPKRCGAYDLVDEIIRPCVCEASGRIFSRCDDPIHNQALGYRAGCYEELNKLDLARRDAEWALELHPLRVEAYLRLGKVARLQGKHFLAWQIYSAGVEVGRRNGLAGGAMFRKLLDMRSRLHSKFCRLNPLELPGEIVEQILSYFDTRALCACLRVSKSWWRALTGRPFIWRHMSFDPLARHIPGLNSLRRIIKYSNNDLRSLSIPNTNKFNLEPKFPAILTGSRNMTDLHLHGTPVNCGDGLSRATWPLSKLTHLTLMSYMFWEHSAPGPSDTNRLLTDILIRNADHISFVSITSDHINFGPSWPRMEKLKHLKLVEAPKQTLPNTMRHRQTVDIALLQSKAPNLEQLWLDACHFSNTLEEDSPNTDCFRHLRFLIVGPRVYWPCVGAPVKELVFLHRVGIGTTDQPEEVFHLSGVADPNHPLPDNVLGKAQHMYLPQFSPDSVYDEPAKACIRQGVGRAIKGGTLRTLALMVYMSTHHQDYLSTFDWIRGCPSVRTLSISICSEPYNSQAELLVGQGVYPNVDTSPRLVGEFVHSFPNLETLEVLGDAGFVTTLGIIIEASVGVGDRTPIKKVYQEGITGYPFDKVRQYLGGKSVELVYGRIPDPKFPIELE
ncbi:uncharacterized protein DNG_00897 [Cephalotrichum gorgonifer]|uniref:F-box domain-containing protein n=1 Tax=Cephalotrichum gorgonifer TaxID=2041049 RepID=A0AAE8MPX2_9PEZI|nr:uncharacterized protein DNG_00897 [Cephalotrichum gorgonifer]